MVAPNDRRTRQVEGPRRCAMEGVDVPGRATRFYRAEDVTCTERSVPYALGERLAASRENQTRPVILSGNLCTRLRLLSASGAGILAGPDGPHRATPDGSGRGVGRAFQPDAGRSGRIGVGLKSPTYADRAGPPDPPRRPCSKYRAPEQRPRIPPEAGTPTRPSSDATRPTAGLLPGTDRFGERTTPAVGLETRSAGPRPTKGPAQCRPGGLLCEVFSPGRPKTCAATSPENARIALTESQS
jgi:hypothetical protein